MSEEQDWDTARAEAEAIATRWVPAHMAARQEMVDNIAASIFNAKRLGRDGAYEVARRLREALESAMYGDDVEWDAASTLLTQLPICVHCGHMDVGHEALHKFTIRGSR